MKRVLITGGSSGIGYEMSRRWADHGYALLWVSHDKDELSVAEKKIKQEFPNLTLSSLVQDLSVADGPQKVFDWATASGAIDVLINNAGIGTYGYLHETDMDKELRMININVVALYKMTRYFLDYMKAKKAGTIINICSNSSFQPVPRMVSYASTKGFVSQFSRGLHEELKMQKSNVKVMTVCPAAISDTAFRGLLQSDVKTFSGLATTTAEEVADDVWRGYSKGKSFIVSGRRMRMLYAIQGLLPYGLRQALVKKETEKA